MSAAVEPSARLRSLKDSLEEAIAESQLPSKLLVDISSEASLERLLNRLHDDPKLVERSSKLRSLIADYLLLLEGYDFKDRSEE